MNSVELLIKRCKVAYGCAWEAGEGGNKTESQESEVRNILRDCVRMLEALNKEMNAYAESLDQIRVELGQTETHYLVMPDDVKMVMDFVKRCSEEQDGYKARELLQKLRGG